ncbi:MAG: NADH-quinone oxidoreductase subunit M, partial [Chthoniobacterales bacterium]|nr:NADH-quinone oxidoreductase subunit M [Chthoniobacterales bacterium]
AVWIAGIGMVVVAAFTLRALVKTFFSAAPNELTPPQTETLPPITLPEKLGAGLLIVVTLAAGIYPKILFDRITPAIEVMRFLQR